MEKYLFDPDDECLDANTRQTRIFPFSHNHNSLIINSRLLQTYTKIFEKLFEAAEIAKFTPEEREAYEESLKHYRDIKNIVDTSKEEGREERTIEFARKMKNSGEPVSKIIEYTGLTEKQIEQL